MYCLLHSKNTRCCQFEKQLVSDFILLLLVTHAMFGLDTNNVTLVTSFPATGSILFAHLTFLHLYL